MKLSKSKLALAKVINENGGWVEHGKAMPNWHQCALSREEYYQAYPEADADGWIERIKSAQQADVFSVVDVRFRDGGTAFGPAHVFDWSVDGGEDDIIAYRPHKPEAKPEFCEYVMRSIPEPEANPTIDQLAQDYRNKIDCARRRLGKAEVASHAASYALSLLRSACKEFGLDVSPSVDAKDKLKSILKS